MSPSSSTLSTAQGKITLDTQEINVHEHLIIYFDFDLKRTKFTVTFNIYPFYHSSKMLPNVQYTAACSPLTLLVTVQSTQERNNATTKKCRKCEKTHDLKREICQAYRRTCFKCGKYNHFAAMCRSRARVNRNTAKQLELKNLWKPKIPSVMKSIAPPVSPQYSSVILSW